MGGLDELYELKVENLPLARHTNRQGRPEGDLRLRVEALGVSDWELRPLDRPLDGPGQLQVGEVAKETLFGESNPEALDRKRRLLPLRRGTVGYPFLHSLYIDLGRLGPLFTGLEERSPYRVAVLLLQELSLVAHMDVGPGQSLIQRDDPVRIPDRV